MAQIPKIPGDGQSNLLEYVVDVVRTNHRRYKLKGFLGTSDEDFEWAMKINFGIPVPRPGTYDGCSISRCSNRCTKAPSFNGADVLQEFRPDTPSLVCFCSTPAVHAGASHVSLQKRARELAFATDPQIHPHALRSALIS